MNPTDRLVEEAKQDLVPDVSDERWGAIEAQILQEMRGPVRLAQAAPSPGGHVRLLRVGAAVLAAAAALALVAKSERAADPFDASSRSSAEVNAGSLRSTEGGGDVRVGGVPVSGGHVLRPQDLIETDGTRALLERPRRVSWLVEGAESAMGRVRVKSAGSTLVVDLLEGAVEAQVTPVPAGEAFAVDVSVGERTVRVAVHGTHLRVARRGGRVLLDLSEGVVSIGTPPRVGITYGRLVTAPAHVEFDAEDLEHSLTVSHVPGEVRAPISLVPHETPLVLGVSRAEPLIREAAPAVVTTSPAATTTAPRLEATVRPAPRETEATSTSQKMPAVSPRDLIAAAVRACAAAPARPDNVRVSVASTLKLNVGATGAIERAQFEPPLLPEIQTCIAAQVYKLKLAESADSTLSVPVEFTY
jgi:hypothetical protein